MKEGDPLGTKRDMAVEQWGEGRRPAGGPRGTWWWSNGVKEGDPLGTNRDMVVEQWGEGRRPAGDQERHGGGAMG